MMYKSITCKRMIEITEWNKAPMEESHKLARLFGGEYPLSRGVMIHLEESILESNHGHFLRLHNSDSDSNSI